MAYSGKNHVGRNTVFACKKERHEQEQAKEARIALGNRQGADPGSARDSTGGWHVQHGSPYRNLPDAIERVHDQVG